MAIALNGSPITANGATGANSLTMPLWTPAANDLILLGVVYREDLASITGITGNGLTWTAVATVTNTQLQGEMAIWRASGAAPTTVQIVISLTGNTASAPVIGIAQRFSGVDVASANQGVEASATNVGPATDNADMLQAITTITDNAWAVSVGHSRTSPTFTTPSGETTILINQSAGASGNITKAHMWYQGPVSPAGSTQLGATADLSAVADWCMIAVSLKPASTGPTPIGKAVRYDWNLRQLASDNVRFDWSLRQLAPDSMRADWELRQLASDAARFDWNISGAVGRSNQLPWDIRQFAGDAVRADWNIQQLAGDAIRFDYDLRQLASDSLRADWNIVSVVGDSVRLDFDIRQLAGDAARFDYDIRALAGDSVRADWNIITAIGKSLRLDYDLRQFVNDTVRLDWNLRQLASDSVRLDWSIRQAVADAIRFDWDIAGAIGKSVRFDFALRQFASDAVRYDWDIRQLASDVVRAVWDVRQFASDSLRADWNIRNLVGQFVRADWNLRQLAGQSTRLDWALRQLASKPVELGWALRQFASDSLQAVWDILSGIAVAVATYGAAWGANSLRNFEIEKFTGQRLGYRFRATTTSSPVSVRFYVKTGVGYSAGTGGGLLVELRTDNPAGNVPSGTVLASGSISDPGTGAFNRMVTFSSAPPLQTGQFYHIVFSNTDANPAANYVSINTLDNNGGLMQPGIANADLAVNRIVSGSWSFISDGATPIFALAYANGLTQGQGYIDAILSGALPISGTNQVRELFTVSDGDHVVSHVSAHLKRVGTASGTLTVSLFDHNNNTLVEEGNITSSDVPTSPAWVSYTLTVPRTLHNATTYRLNLKATGGGAYQIYPLQKGGNYGFNVPALFANGHFQSTVSDPTWISFQNAPEFDMQFYFTRMPTQWTSAKTGRGSFTCFASKTGRDFTRDEKTGRVSP